MRNLRKYFAVFLAVAMLVTAMAPAFAAEDTATKASSSLTDAKVVETLGIIKGEGGSISDDYLKSSVTRLQAAILFLRLKGLESAALAFTGTENFEDADKVDWDGGKAVLAYLKANKDLGWQGDGTNFNPNGTISAQEYYKILLVSLGYVEGTDFKYEDTLKFAESKGLKAAAKADPFTINDVAAATVEALKATKADGKTTLLQSLIDAKAIDKAKAQTAGLISTVTSKFDLTNGAKSLTVKFDAAPADTSKVAITVTRDAGTAVTDLTTTWSADKTTATLGKTTNLVAGEYKVAVKNDTVDLGSKTAKVESEKLAKIELTSKVINRRNDTEGIAYYKVSNQYGEDVTKNSIASNIQWNSSLGSGSVSADKGLLTFTKGVTEDTAYMSKLKDYTTVPVVITAYETDSSISFNDSLTVATTVGDIQSIKLLGISNKDKKTSVEKGTADIFYLDYEIKDSVGNLVTDYAILSNSGAFTLSPKAGNESSIIYAQVVQDPDDSKKAKFQLKGEGINNQIAGTQVISAIALTSGKSATINVEVVEGSALKEFILQKPALDVAQGDGKVEIPYIALDSNGEALTDYNKIKQGNIRFGGLNSYDEVQKSDGSYGLYMDFGTVETTFTVTATVTTTTSSKMSQMSISVKKYAHPDDLTAINLTDCPQGVASGASVSPAADKFTVLDQYGRSVNLKHAFNFTDNGLYTLANGRAVTNSVYEATYAVNSGAYLASDFTTLPASNLYPPIAFYLGKDGNLYYIAMSSSDQNTIVTKPSSQSLVSTTDENYIVASDPMDTATTPKNYTIISGNKTGFYAPATNLDISADSTKSATITYSLRKIPTGAAVSKEALVTTRTSTTTNQIIKNWTEVDSFSQTVYNVDREDITEYKFDNVTTPLYAATLTGLGSIFARQDTIVSGSRTAQISPNTQQTTKQEREWNMEYKIRGYYNGIRTLLPTSDAVSFSVSDPDKFALNVPAGAQSVYVLAKAWNTTDQAATFKSKLSAQVRGYNSVFYSASTDITAAVATPIISEITVERNDYSTVQNIGTDYYVVSANDFNNRVNNKYIIAFNTAGENTNLATGNAALDGNYIPNATQRSDIYFMCKDQYGKKGTLPASLQVVKVSGTTFTPVANAVTNGLLSITNVAQGEQYKITIVAPNGTAKTVIIDIE